MCLILVKSDEKTKKSDSTVTLTKAQLDTIIATIGALSAQNEQLVKDHGIIVYRTCDKKNVQKFKIKRFYFNHICKLINITIKIR